MVTMKTLSRYRDLLKHTFIDYRPTAEILKQPLIFSRAEGLYYWDMRGRRYFDAIGGIFVAVLGHRHPRVMEALRKQMEKITFAPPLHGIADVTLDFIEKLGSVTPGNLNFIKPFSGGSESIESAMKFVRQYFKQSGFPGKHKFISLYHGYHGATFGAMAASGTGKRKSKFDPQMGGFVKVFMPHHYRDMFASFAEANRHAAKMIEDVIEAEDPDTVAGVMLEPISNTGGIVAPTDEFFALLKKSCVKHRVMLIFDEIITGFGRTGNMFAAQTFKVLPDIICAGKGLASGAMPLGAMIARTDMAGAFFGSPAKEIQFAHGHTFAGNPLACAAGIAVIDEIVEKKLAQRAQRLGNYLAVKLEGLKKFGVVREIRGKGMLRGIELVKDMKKKEPFNALGMALKRTSLKNGLIMRINPDWFAVAPALIAEEKQIDEMCALIEKSLNEALAEL